MRQCATLIPEMFLRVVTPLMVSKLLLLVGPAQLNKKGLLPRTRLHRLGQQCPGKPASAHGERRGRYIPNMTASV